MKRHLIIILVTLFPFFGFSFLCVSNTLVTINYTEGSKSNIHTTVPVKNNKWMLIGQYSGQTKNIFLLRATKKKKLWHSELLVLSGKDFYDVKHDFKWVVRQGRKYHAALEGSTITIKYLSVQDENHLSSRESTLTVNNYNHG